MPIPAGDVSARAAVGAGIGATALVMAYWTSRRPALALAGVLALIGLALVASHLLASVGLLAASFYFEEYLSKEGQFLTPAKAVGALAVVAWIIHSAVRRRPVIGAPQLWAVCGLAVWVLPSMALAHNEGRALEVGTRYGMFFALFFLVLQAVGHDRTRVEVLVDVVVVAAAASALLGLLPFLAGTVDRARGPLEDPNDFGFLLASTLPLMLFRLRQPRGTLHRSVIVLCLVVTSAAVLATFSRGALLGLAVATAWALATGRLSVRHGLAIVAGVGLVAIVGFWLEPEIVQDALTRKQHVAGANVESRLVTWKVAVEQARTAPLTGVGPGNYESRYPEFERMPADATKAPTTHNAYLHVLAELGVPGLGLFSLFLVLSWLRLRVRDPADRSTDGLRSALAAGFLVAVVGAFFLTEQFYPPLWFLSALAAGLGAGAAGATSRLDS